MIPRRPTVAVSAASPMPVQSPDLPAIPVRDLLPWALFTGLLALILLYFIGAEQGATSLISGNYVHEFVHYGRHLLGFPCH